MTAKRPVTKLAFKLREAILKADPSNIRLRLYAHAADELDTSAFSLGVKGAAVKGLASYYNAKRYFEELTGKPYED